MLHRLADAVEQRKPIIAQIESLDCGKIYWQAEGDVQNFVDTLRYFIQIAVQAEPRSTIAVARHEAWSVRQPWGPCGFIFPWNFPFLLAGWGISPALAAGNTVVIKPAEDTPLSTIYLARLAREVGIPAGVINVVPGLGETAGAALAAHPGVRRISFTGSPEVGRLVAEACGRNLVPAKLELGGKGAAVVFADVNLPDTVEKLAQAITFHTGQVSCDATRWLVHETVSRSPSSKRCRRATPASSRLSAISWPRSTADGPGRQREAAPHACWAISARAAAQAHETSGRRAARPAVPGRQRLLCPARRLLAGPLDNVAAREEIFGPVAYLASFRGEDEAICMANTTDYGLANSVWTTDLARPVWLSRWWRETAGSTPTTCLPRAFPMEVSIRAAWGAGCCLCTRTLTICAARRLCDLCKGHLRSVFTAHEPLGLGCARLDSHCSTERRHDRAVGIWFRLIDAAMDRHDPFVARRRDGRTWKENDFSQVFNNNPRRTTIGS